MITSDYIITVFCQADRAVSHGTMHNANLIYDCTLHSLVNFIKRNETTALHR